MTMKLYWGESPIEFTASTEDVSSHGEYVGYVADGWSSRIRFREEKRHYEASLWSPHHPHNSLHLHAVGESRQEALNAVRELLVRAPTTGMPGILPVIWGDEALSAVAFGENNWQVKMGSGILRIRTHEGHRWSAIVELIDAQNITVGMVTTGAARYVAPEHAVAALRRAIQMTEEL